ncbi:MAG TPA: 16S rRNA (cytidine(1402)-2'-O)-methyltransferase [Myxococcota bacterium]|nr:16S rRNA (cytidine(1402)-2'-O)-methyltransferase [Myxococcota bacterium]
MSALYLVATPIGNLEDVSLRALRVLGEVELVLAEDTRRTRILLERHRIGAKPVSLHAHNEAARTAEVVARLDAGGDVALVSDAGTPLISDPGDRIVAAALAAGHEVIAIPGASAVLSALCVSGLPAAPFSFVGFLPRRARECERALAALSERCETLVFFESPRRVAATLARLRAALGDRRACAARELTKLHEEVVRGTLGELERRFASGARGELTLVVAGASEPRRALAGDELEAEIRALSEAGHSARAIAERLARAAGLAKREIYARAVALRRARPDAD